MHNCLVCHHSDVWRKPVSMTTGNHLHFSFTCFGGNPNPRLNHDGVIIMIYDICTDECWIDGSCTIPKHGCLNFVQAESVNKEVIES